MRVLFISRATLLTAPGGDTVQIRNTADALKDLGVQVDIKLTNEKIDYSLYDLLHFFNVIRPADILGHIRRSKKPFVVTPIFVDYKEFDSFQRKGIVRLLYKLSGSSHTVEYIKVIARYIFNNEKINSLEFLIKGQKKSIQYILRNAKVLLPNSNSEYNRLLAAFSVNNRFVVVPNAIDPEKFSADDNSKFSPADRTDVITIARFEGLKNQHQIINALNDTKYNVKLIGKASPNQKGYLELCKKMAASNIEFIHHMEQDKLFAFYRRAKVHVLPSWFETTGLSSLEAAAMGCNVVISDKGDQKEYFKHYAFYCDPASPESIAEQVEKAFITQPDPEFQQYVLQNYTWKKTAERTLEAYNLALQG
ncbi:glycosyltransferase family 4 protein [Pontibacter sp. BT310]|uniref:Glycosyltransferase family 4 protein n=1 Tax=Pontibacter populi TaxID=890055 RepID=A0ABS6XBB8_9BACT|nr:MULTISPECIES: glycosyltransferase family 4 protein [Pontibacter]MBJ6118427.1 glycosyltransferase family 4 protein [Pontibacter sp. BT310]MBR0570855.1 glycosyltransferase family 4 protein [Microvirga sp. STS03]MBW3365281.1 glycosyltransferase family 4 protein [Pontibacter populi]